MMPVRRRIIKTNCNIVLVTCLGQFSANVPFKRSASNIIVSEFAVEHDKSIVVLRGKYDIFHPGIFRDVHPGICVEVARVELMIKFIIFGSGCAVSNGFIPVRAPPCAAPAQFPPGDSAWSEMNEHSEP